jgi:hypothetical protein
MNVRWTGTGGLSDTQSYSWIILNAIFDRISSSSFFSGFTCKRVASAVPVELWNQVPFIGVFLGEDNLTPDGELQTGDIRFIHAVNIGFQIVVRNNDAVEMQKKLDQASWFILNQLLRDNTFTNRLHTTMPDNTTFEGIARIRFRPDMWGLGGSKNETPVGERLFVMVFQIRTMWAPTDFPDLERITVTTAFPLDGDPTQVQQVKVVYEFNPDPVPLPLPPDP